MAGEELASLVVVRLCRRVTSSEPTGLSAGSSAALSWVGHLLQTQKAPPDWHSDSDSDSADSEAAAASALCREQLALPQGGGGSSAESASSSLHAGDGGAESQREIPSAVEEGGGASAAQRHSSEGMAEEESLRDVSSGSVFDLEAQLCRRRPPESARPNVTLSPSAASASSRLDVAPGPPTFGTTHGRRPLTFERLASLQRGRRRNAVVQESQLSPPASFALRGHRREAAAPRRAQVR